MTNLSYKLSNLAQNWVLWCEGVPIDRFDCKSAGVEAAMRLVTAAQDRGDRSTLVVVERAERP